MANEIQLPANDIIGLAHELQEYCSKNSNILEKHTAYKEATATAYATENNLLRETRTKQNLVTFRQSSSLRALNNPDYLPADVEKFQVNTRIIMLRTKDIRINSSQALISVANGQSGNSEVASLATPLVLPRNRKPKLPPSRVKLPKLGASSNCATLKDKSLSCKEAFSCSTLQTQVSDEKVGQEGNFLRDSEKARWYREGRYSCDRCGQIKSGHICLVNANRRSCGVDTHHSRQSWRMKKFYEYDKVLLCRNQWQEAKAE